MKLTKYLPSLPPLSADLSFGLWPGAQAAAARLPSGPGGPGVSLALIGRQISRSGDIRCACRKTAVGDDLVLWVRVNAAKPVAFEILPKKG